MSAPRKLPPLVALRAFEACARLMSFTRAAEELDVTPGAISQQIRQLEAYAGTPLFRRLGRGVLLTDAAQQALPMVRDAFDRLSEAGHVMQAPQRQGRVVVSVAPSFATKWLMPRLEAFQSRAPEIEVWVSADARLTDFTDGAVDLAIRYGPGSYEGLKAEKLLEEAVLPVCSPAIAASLKKPADLRGVSLLHDDSPDNDPSCPSWSMWLSARGVTGVDGTRGPRFNQGALVVEAAAHGRGVGLAKRAIADTDLLSGRLVAPFADGAAPINFAYWLAWPKGRTLRPQVRTFINWLRAEAHLSEGAGV